MINRRQPQVGVADSWAISPSFLKKQTDLVGATEP
jgi:hypothetical protein